MSEEQKPLSIPVSRLLEIDEEQNYPIGFKLVAGQQGLTNEIQTEETDRPGLPLAGFFDRFSPNRIQIFGRGEMAYIQKMAEDGGTENIRKFFEYRVPVCVVTTDMEIPGLIIELCDRYATPLLQTKLDSRRFISLITTILSDVFAPSVTMHGDFVSIHNIGVLIIGKSGIGKSECVLGLVERGHKFICDDIVKLKKIRTANGYELFGEPNISYGPYIEIRGIGIINVSQYFGEGRVLSSERLGLIIELHEWNTTYNYDRLGMEETYRDILDIQIPFKQLPISSSRNVSLLVEVAAYREVMRRLGYNSAEELDTKIISFMKKEQAGKQFHKGQQG